MADLIESTGIIDPFSRLMTLLERGGDPDVMKKMMDMAETWQKNRAAEEFAQALTGFQAECLTIKKTHQVNDKQGRLMYMFASFDDVMRVARPYLAKNNIVVTFSERPTEAGLMEIRCRIRVGTHYEDSFLTAPAPDILNTNGTQRAGGGMKYLQRYALCAALNIVVEDEDDDAQTAALFISAKQVAELNTLIVEKEVDLDRFLAWAKIEHLDEMPLDFMPKALDMLRRRKKGQVQS